MNLYLLLGEVPQVRAYADRLDLTFTCGVIGEFLPIGRVGSGPGGEYSGLVSSASTPAGLLEDYQVLDQIPTVVGSSGHFHLYSRGIYR